MEKRGQMSGNAVQCRWPRAPGAVFLGPFDPFPMHPDLVDALRLGVAEDMRVSANQFMGDVSRDLCEVEGPALFCELAVEDHLQEQIAQLLPHLAVVTRFDGVHEFVDFLDGMEA